MQTGPLPINDTPPPTLIPTSFVHAAEVAAVAEHLLKLDRHLAVLGKRAEAAVARRLAERLRATLLRLRLP